MISHRSALEGGVSPAGFIVLSYKYTKKIVLPGLTIRLVEGPGPQPGDTPFMERLFLASRPRALLENLEASRGNTAKALGRKYIESHLDKLARIHGFEELNHLRDQARALYPALGLSKEFKLLDSIIGALLGTHDVKLSATAAKARAAGKPYDTDRIELFSILSEVIIRSILPKIKYPHHDLDWNNNLAFFEAYFSNYIEGTE
ncbi:MAG: cell filamentation protein Fic, partial [Bacteroidota bacterium]|nr:cell filamentation protein Fic [Bacteroidota bacterium]